jgi:hypothetical protein
MNKNLMVYEADQVAVITAKHNIVDLQPILIELKLIKDLLKDVKYKNQIQLFYNHNISNCTKNNTFLINESNINKNSCLLCNYKDADVFALQFITSHKNNNDRMVFNFCKSCYINKIYDFIYLNDGSDFREKLLYFKVIEKEILYLFESDISAT